ncbi:golgi phosphoprotein 3 domain-containing protein [Coprinopsis cinerea okayama7|uniref:Golgi phosphoprotein 3 domain-containing protein n=1 Tax=Coprinopsis cinerea (strain Okayama-7 / 130 / ATCC MYA-4618 / FGSC 9003) TaxID=240176 RepID=A8NKW0_COPC7|nr:golgi phosphoprotein 3 domain-containing protein [Coprinopsis cinerea okayama7\|eukprot:XP_001834558.2 golgi phosphoprotein 3 domain-containing protein [Coprinopsis cinerea okayama7\
MEQAAGEEARVGGKLPKLTIMEEIMLLAVKDKQGYLSFWNDNISYALRGCILIELALRRRIALVRDPNRRRVTPGERIVEVIDDRQTGETILDEALRLMKGQQDIEKLSVNTWIDLMSGETWNVMKVGFQLKQVRERLLKGLVDKGILRTEKRNFLLFDMATHPLADVRAKESVINRVVALLTSTTSAIPPVAINIPPADSRGGLGDGSSSGGLGGGGGAEKEKDTVQCRVTRTVCMVCAAYAGSVLDNAFGRLGYEDREAAFGRCDDILSEFCVWPFGVQEGSGSGSGGFGSSTPSSASAASRRASLANRIATGGSNDPYGRESVLGLVAEARKEAKGGEDDLGFELVAGVLEVLGRLDSLL